MMQPSLTYPIELDALAIEQVLPHRGEILCVKRLVVLGANHYVGYAVWTDDLPILQGHFPGMPMVPGVLLLEAVAQVAGAGMLVGDDLARGMRDSHVGVLAGVRKCSFKRPVLANETVKIEARSRQMSPTAAFITGQLWIDAEEVAYVEILVINTPREALAATLDAPMPRSSAWPDGSS